MLVIRRREGESLLMGGNIEITVLELSPSRVKLGISAPTEVVVLRKEVRLTEDENRAASRFNPSQLRVSPGGASTETP